MKSRPATYKSPSLRAALALGLMVLAWPNSAASVTYRVRMNTALWSGVPGYVVVSMTSGVEEGGTNQSVTICNVNGNAIRGQTLTTGGGRGGDLIYNIGSTPAPCTELAPKVVTSVLNDREAYFYSHLGINLALRANTAMQIPNFRDSLVFDVVLPFPVVRGSFEDQVTVHVLSALGEPAFATGDPLGSDAICSFTAPKVTNGQWAAEYFSPATYTSAQGQTPATITVQFPSPPPSLVQPVTNLTGEGGTTSVAIWWNEPGQTIGTAQQYEIRRLVNSTINDTNWWSGTIVPYSFAPGPIGTPHCKSSLDLQECRMYSFGIKTQQNGVWSLVSNVVNINTECSGFGDVMCEGEGLFGGGGGESAQTMGLASAGVRRNQGDALGNEQSIQLGSAEQDATDLLALPSGTTLAHTIQMHQVGGIESTVDQVSLGVVEHSQETSAFPGKDSVYVGTVAPVASVLDSLGVTLSQFIEGEAFLGRAGSYIDVVLGPSRGGRNVLLVESTRPQATLVSTKCGILMQHRAQGGHWTAISRVFPRRDWAWSAVASQGSDTLRLVFERDYQIRSIRRLVDAEARVPDLYQPDEVNHSRDGDVRDAVRDNGGMTSILAPEDTLTLSFTSNFDADGRGRDIFLLVKGFSSGGSSAMSAIAQQVQTGSDVTLVFSLKPPRPNPSIGMTSIGYTLARECRAELKVYDIAGRLVRNLVGATQPAGPHEVVWDGRDHAGRRVGSGVYFYQLVTDGWKSQRKVIVLQP